VEPGVLERITSLGVDENERKLGICHRQPQWPICTKRPDHDIDAELALDRRCEGKIAAANGVPC